MQREGSTPAILRRCIGKIRKEKEKDEKLWERLPEFFLHRSSTLKCIFLQISNNFSGNFLTNREELRPRTSTTIVLVILLENYPQPRPSNPSTINFHFVLKIVLINRGLSPRTSRNRNYKKIFIRNCVFLREFLIFQRFSPASRGCYLLAPYWSSIHAHLLDFNKNFLATPLALL